MVLLQMKSRSLSDFFSEKKTQRDFRGKGNPTETIQNPEFLGRQMA